ncbi:phage baseplate protein [Burkholderia cenocepacia]|nr:phage baseplate protein [Burkholderia cenocepacia]
MDEYRDTAKAEEAEIYGTGWSFPVTFRVQEDPYSSSIALTGGAENVRQGVAMLCRTQPGERIMRPMYGCDLESIVFANLTQENLAALRTRVMESITRFEPRAAVLGVDCAENAHRSGQLDVTVRYQLAGQMEVQQLSGAVDVRDGTGSTF